MRSVSLITLLGLFTQACATDKLLDKLVGKLADEALVVWPFQHALVDNMTLGKPGHLALLTSRLAPFNAQALLRGNRKAANGLWARKNVQAVQPAISVRKELKSILPLRAVSTGEAAAQIQTEVAPEHQGEAKRTNRTNVRTTKESQTGRRIDEGGLIGGPFQRSDGSAYLERRIAIWDRLFTEQEEKVAALPDEPIKVTLPDGTVKPGVAFKTSPMDIAMNISAGLARSVIIARVKYSRRLDTDAKLADGSGMQEETTLLRPGVKMITKGELWDMGRPLVGDCTLSLLKYDPDDAEVRSVFWHSSAHVLGAALESTFGAYLTIGPPLKSGFYYDSYMGDLSVTDSDMSDLNKAAIKFSKKKHKFVRLEVSKTDALEMFAENPFKVKLITNKVPDGGFTSVYRCGPMIDLCMGPHIPTTGKIQAFATTTASGTNWLGQTDNDRLQRVYGIAFPDKAEMKKWKELQELAKARDHQALGAKQELFFFNPLSPGSAFWLPHGTRIYNKLVEFIKKQYWARGYQEVITPNIFNMKLWEQSGHALHYKENMFRFNVEEEEFGLKPMNCPGHCCLFAHRPRSYRELPMRVADFGVLHRNELSGALTGLTRVRRFQQDDAHIFCTEDQVKQEVLAELNFMKFVYTTFGMTYRLELSTRPKKALGDLELWEKAEGQLQEALDEFAGEGNWHVNPGDGAFYGPKIDIKVYDAMERVHQCATVQLDFQLPIRFDLKYVCPVDNAATAGQEMSNFSRPVMVHRAMLGSVERIIAVLTEHWGGKWPLWVSPRQMCVVPVGLAFAEYAETVKQRLQAAGFYADVDASTRTLNKKVREAQQAQYNFILVVGEKEKDAGGVNIRTRDGELVGDMSVDDAIAKFEALVAEYK